MDKRNGKRKINARGAKNVDMSYGQGDPDYSNFSSPSYYCGNCGSTIVYPYKWRLIDESILFFRKLTKARSCFSLPEFATSELGLFIAGNFVEGGHFRIRSKDEQRIDSLGIISLTFPI